MKNRIDRLSYFMEMADLTAERGTCNKLKVGCVLIDYNTNRIVSVGYNSSHKDTVHCIDGECLIIDDHCIRTLHAEQAAVMNLEHKYEKLKCFTTHKPCVNCYKLLAAANVSEIYFIHDYIDPGREILNKEIKIKFIKLTKVGINEWKIAKDI